MKKTLVLIFLVHQLIMIGCSESGRRDSNKDEESISSIDDTNQTTDDTSNVVHQNTIEPYKSVDSLVRVIKQNFNTYSVKELDEICSTSDGDLSESFWDTMPMLFDIHLKEFIDYFLKLPESSLKRRLIEGIGVHISMYEKTEWQTRLLNEQERIIEKASSEGASKTQLEFIENLFKEVNPNLLD